MLKIIFALAPVGIILLVSEYLWRKKIVKGERARKFIHILAGAWMAFWPYYVPFDGIFILACFALIALVYSRVTGLFHAIYAVKRRTYGELFFALTLIIISYIAKAPWIFTVSVLLMAVADGGAAVVGRFHGVSNQYFVFGWPVLRKSIAGTSAYIGLTYFCLFVGWMVGGTQIINDNLLVCLIVLPACVAILENVSPFGLDNVLTPLFATVLLNSLL